MTLTQQIGLVLVILCGSGAILYGLWALFTYYVTPDPDDNWPEFVEQARITPQDSREREYRRWTR